MNQLEREGDRQAQLGEALEEIEQAGDGDGCRDEWRSLPESHNTLSCAHGNRTSLPPDTILGASPTGHSVYAASASRPCSKDTLARGMPRRGPNRSTVQPTEVRTDMSCKAESVAYSDEQLQQLLDSCAAADGAALQRLYELVAPVLLGCLTRMLRRRAVAEEALQDVFVSIWQRAGQFRATRGRPMAWMMSIARYRAIDLLRRERHAPMLVSDPELRTAVPDEAAPESYPWLSGTALLERCMQRLSVQQQRCLELAYVGGNSHESIARLTGNPVGSVKSWIRRGLQSLRQCLEA
jgi:RNA polymerase sigma-70 factor, ECF subfamily